MIGGEVSFLLSFFLAEHIGYLFVIFGFPGISGCFITQIVRPLRGPLSDGKEKSYALT